MFGKLVPNRCQFFLKSGAESRSNSVSSFGLLPASILMSKIVDVAKMALPLAVFRNCNGQPTAGITKCHGQTNVRG